MKKVLFAAICLFGLISCQKELEFAQTPESSTEITAFAQATPEVKVAFSEDAATHNFQGKWEVGDIIFGFTEGGSSFEFQVESVDASTGVATLKQTSSVAFAEGDKLHAIHCPGKTKADLDSESLSVDFSAQQADVIPVLMLSDAIVTAGPSVTFEFSNATAIVGLVKPVFPTAMTEGKAVKKAILSGHNLVSAGKVSVEGGKLVFKADVPSKFIEKSVSIIGSAGEGSSYTIKKPIHIVVPAGEVEKLTVKDNKNNYYQYEIGKTAAASKYYRISGKEIPRVAQPASSTIVAGGAEWASCNFGTDKATNTGEVYRWSDTGIIYTYKDNEKITPDANHSAGFADYVGEIYCTEAGVYSKYNSTGLTLDPVDDIVQLAYPGTGWRIPTVEEFNALVALKDNSDYTWENNPGTNVGIKITRNSDSESIFLRANHPCSKGGTTMAINVGRYWTSSSTNDAAKAYAAQYFAITVSNKKATGATTTGITKRYIGYAIRPVKTVAE